ncbi:MAG: 2OG-Fe(II) oxygenase [Candidatus Sericytochromatia bacterium]
MIQDPKLSTLPDNNHILRVLSYPNIFKPEECEEIINMKGINIEIPVYFESQEDYDKTNIAEYPIAKDLLQNRITVGWISKKLEKVLMHANDKFFHFEIYGINVIRLNKYDVGRSFNWHTDIGNRELSIRKLTLVVFLSKKEDYTGGELQWWGVDDKINQEQGSIVVFPSYMMHYVPPITSGVRYSLACWAVGPHFK